ncbi:MAG TPA: serine hydrolase domain-containing protein [Trebonia sp.]|nr:serine hydrolase domain-containing protein [Trebonia sp.]
MTRRIDALVAAMTGWGGPGAAVAVARRGEPVYRGCFGLADVEWRQPVTPDTVFALASLSKPLTAITVVLLARDGLINLDAAVGDYLPEYAGPGRAALVRHLLTHTSGIPNFVTLSGFRDGAAHLDHRPAQMMEVFAALPLDFEPGTRYGYSNSGYRLPATGHHRRESRRGTIRRCDHRAGAPPGGHGRRPAAHRPGRHPLAGPRVRAVRRRPGGSAAREHDDPWRRGGPSRVAAGHARLRSGAAPACPDQPAGRAADARADAPDVHQV